MIRVASLTDPRLADYSSIADHRALVARGLFVVEGRLVLTRLLESVATRFPLASVLLTGAALEALESALRAHPVDAPIYVVDQSTMNAVAGFNIHRGCLALARRPAARVLAPADVAASRRVVVLERVSNPDNIGGLFRSAAALGADLVVLGPACGDPLYRKAVRTSMGAVLTVPFVEAGPWPQALRTLADQQVTIVALTPHRDAIALPSLPPIAGPMALMLGHEGEGLSDDALAAASVRVRIPMAAAVDSLNVASAASIAMYQIFRNGG